MDLIGAGLLESVQQPEAKSLYINGETPMKRKNKVLSIIFITIILIFSFFGGLYILGTQGEAYKFALRFINGNSTVMNNIGLLRSSRLAFFGYSLRYSGPHGNAEYKIIVTGEKGKGTIYLNLEKSAGVWEVIKGNLVLENGESISLMPTPSSPSRQTP